MVLMFFLEYNVDIFYWYYLKVILRISCSALLVIILYSYSVPLVRLGRNQLFRPSAHGSYYHSRIIYHSIIWLLFLIFILRAIQSVLSLKSNPNLWICFLIFIYLVICCSFTEWINRIEVDHNYCHLVMQWYAAYLNFV